jgi:integrase
VVKLSFYAGLMPAMKSAMKSHKKPNNNPQGGKKRSPHRRRRYNGQMELYLRNDIYYAIWTENDKTKTKSLRTDDWLLADKALQSFRASYQIGGSSPNAAQKLTFHQAADDYLDDMSKQVSARTMQDYVSFVKRFKKHFSKKALVESVTPLQCDSLRRTMLNEVSPYTVKKKLTALRAIFKRLVRLQILSKNPMDGVVQKGKAGTRAEMPEPIYLEILDKLQREIASEANPLDRSLLQDLRDRTEILWWSGLRTIEVERLKWSDIDLSASGGAVWTIRSPEKKGGITVLPISPVVCKILARRQGNGGASPFLENIRTLNRTWNSFRKRYPHFKDWDQHCIRHSFVSRISRTKGVAMARFLARHNTIEVSQRYDHRNLTELRAAMEDDAA